MADLHAAKPAAGAPRPGAVYYISSFMALSTLGILTVMLGAWFWLSRPVNLGAETDHLSQLIERSLLDNYVPSANIQRGPSCVESTEKEGRETFWTFREFTVTLPPELNTEGFKTQLRKDMSTHVVKLVDKERDPETQNPRVSFFIDNLPFADMTIVPGKPDEAGPYRSDLRNNCNFLAELMETVLAELCGTGAFTRSEPQEREDLNALWQYTRFSANLPTGISLGDVKGRVEARNTLPDVTVSTDPALEPDSCILVSIAGKPCISLACTVAPADEPARPQPVSLTEVIDNSVLGSDPAESNPPEAITPPAPEPMPTVEPAAPSTAPGEETEEAPEATKPMEPETPPETTASPLQQTRNPLQPARVAIIIDDGGNNSSQADRILALDNRLTLAILPHTPFAAETAERGSALGFEIMLHMPMETESKTEEAVEDTLFTAMGKEEIQKNTRVALDEIPGVVGVNNHTGSKFTQNEKKLGWFMDVLLERNLFFVDSVTTAGSVAYDVARKKGVPAGRRDVFLDHDTAEDQVRAQFDRLIQIAVAQGSAIGIGHFQSPATARVLAEEIPKLANANVELVHVSELVQ